MVCPWCAIGLASLEEAIARVGGDVDVEPHVRASETIADMVAEGEDIDDHRAR